MFAIHFSSRAKKEFADLNDKNLENLLKLMQVDPLPAKHYDVKKLKGLDNTFRIRIGKIRVVYTIIWNDKVVLISRIATRESAYD